ncbi:MAG: hypothetical protein EP344_02385 [Bacteroidetes bacterium]|nr:MAG: hypothetical protein EP344_02385 [Bacteroidota bacterium]
MMNKSFNPMFVSALDILTGALGVFIILNFLNTRLAGTTPPAPPVEIAAREDKPDKPLATTPDKREYRNNGRRGTEKYKPVPSQQPAPATPAPAKPEPEAPKVEKPLPPSPPQDPVAVDLMKQTKGDVTLLLQQEGLGKQTVEFMLKQGNMTWKPSRASKYQNNEFQYERSLNYFYQLEIAPGTYEVWTRVKKRSRITGSQPFSLYGKIIQPGYQTLTHNFGTFAVSEGSDWVRAGTFTVTSSEIKYKSNLPEAKAEQPTAAPDKPEPAPETKPKRTGKWG